MIRVVNWNINKKQEPWRVLAAMAERGEADIALLQEACSPPMEISGPRPKSGQALMEALRWRFAAVVMALQLWLV